MGKSIAFKCTYNDGGEGRLVGFSDTCTRENIRRNITHRHVWCSDSNCECRKYYDRGMKGTKPVEPCYESVLFTKWEYGVGWYITGERKGEYIRMKNVDEGKFAILTTCFPGDTESDRRIVGLFQIGQVDNTQETKVFSASDSQIRLSMKEAKRLYYWAYQQTKVGRPDWRTGLFRYLEDSQVHRILADIDAVVRDEDTKRRIRSLINREFGGSPPLANGCLSEKSINLRRNFMGLSS